MLICQNTEGVHAQKKVENPRSRVKTLHNGHTNTAEKFACVAKILPDIDTTTYPSEDFEDIHERKK